MVLPIMACSPLALTLAKFLATFGREAILLQPTVRFPGDGVFDKPLLHCRQQEAHIQIALASQAEDG